MLLFGIGMAYIYTPIKVQADALGDDTSVAGAILCHAC